MRIKLIGLFLSVFLLSGCQTTTQRQNTWVGRHIDSLIAILGTPDGVIQLQKGGTTYTWQETRSRKDSSNYVCKNNYTTNSSGIITITSWTGDYMCGI